MQQNLKSLKSTKSFFPCENNFKAEKIKFLDFIEFFKIFLEIIYIIVYNNIIYK